MARTGVISNDLFALGWRRLGQFFGFTHQGKRNVRLHLGRKDFILPEEYWFRYLRVPLARGIGRILPTWTWRGESEFMVNDAENSTLNELVKTFKLNQALFRLDLLSGVTGYAGILMGGDEGAMEEEPSGPVTSIEVWGANCLEISECDTKTGLPKYYRLRRDGRMDEVKIHASRVIHYADSDEGNMLYGTPILEAAWDILDDIEKAFGANAEAYWQLSVPDLHVDKKVEDDTIATPDALKKVQETISEWQHKLSRIVQTFGDTKLERIAGEPAEGIEKLVDTGIRLICATYLWPKRIFEGSERGELASSQDRGKFEGDIDERRMEVAAPMAEYVILRLAAAAGMLLEGWITVKWTPWSSNRAPDEETKYQTAKATMVTNLVREAVIEPSEALLWLSEALPDDWAPEDVMKELIEAAQEREDDDDDDPPVVPPVPVPAPPIPVPEVA